LIVTVWQNIEFHYTRLTVFLHLV